MASILKADLQRGYRSVNEDLEPPALIMNVGQDSKARYLASKCLP